VRAIVAASVLALIFAAPVGAVSGDDSLGSLHLGSTLAAKAPTRDKSRSCQAGKSTATKTATLGSKRRFAVVACEQPPKSNLITPSMVAKATASALSALG
jgi:hypothetical protein